MEELNKELKNFPNLRRVLISGGEPSLHPQIFDIIRLFSERYKVFMPTNGTLWNEQRMKALKESGLYLLVVSLDGPKNVHERIRGKGTFDKVIETIKLAKNFGIPVSLKMTLNRYNYQYQYVKEFIDIALRLNVDEFAIKRYIPTGRKINNAQDLLITPEQYYKVLTFVQQYAERHPEIKAKFINRDAFVSFLFYDVDNGNFDSYLGGCLAGIAIANILSNGDVTPCTFVHLSAGNIYKDTFTKIWNESELFLKIRKSRLEGKTCKQTCPYKYICGGCRAYAYYFTGDINGYDRGCILPLVDKP